MGLPQYLRCLDRGSFDHLPSTPPHNMLFRFTPPLEYLAAICCISDCSKLMDLAALVLSVARALPIAASYHMQTRSTILEQSLQESTVSPIRTLQRRTPRRSVSAAITDILTPVSFALSPSCWSELPLLYPPLCVLLRNTTISAEMISPQFLQK